MRTLFSIAIASFLLQDPVPPAGAPPPDPKYERLVADLGKCAAIPEGPLRLEAYDALAKKLGVGPKPVEGLGKWDVKISVNPIDDSRSVVASLAADESSTVRLKGDQPAQLVVRCKGGELDAYVIVGVRAEKEEKNEGKATATLRYDKQAAFDLVMDQSTDAEALFWQDAKAELVRMLPAEKMIFVFTPTGAANRALVQFDLRGFALVHQQLVEACPEPK